MNRRQSHAQDIRHTDPQSLPEGISRESTPGNDGNPNAVEVQIDWNGEIAKYTELLRTVMQTSEKGFLTVGSRLQAIQTSTKHISEKLAGLVNDYSEGGNTNALGELRNMTERSAKHLNSFNDYSTQAVSHLQNLESPLASLPDSLQEFDRLVSRLRKMGIIAHIEAARIGDGGVDFVRLAEAVSLLGEQITAKAKEVRAYIKGVTEVITLDKDKIEQMAGKHNDATMHVTDDMQSNLQVLNEKHELYRQTTSGISSKSEDALRSIHVVVESIQYHDITRQQVEHVIEALQSIQQQDSVLEVVPICEIQVAQIKRVGKEFDGAVFSIVNALGDLSNAVTMMLSEAEQMTNFTKDSGSTFFEHVERGFETVSATMMQDRQAVQDLTSSLHKISGNIREMKSFMDEMVDVGSEIELLALNSRVKAAKTGTEGATLGIIAESIQNLSTDTLQQVNEVIKQMAHMVSISGDLTDDHTIETLMHQAETETNELIGKLKDAVQVLHSNNTMSNKVFIETEEMCTAIVRQLESLAVEMDKHRKLGASLSDAGDMLGRLARQLRASVPDSAQLTIDKRLEDIRKRYTMETERLTHHAVINGNKEQGGTPNVGAGEVELF